MPEQLEDAGVEAEQGHAERFSGDEMDLRERYSNLQPEARYSCVVSMDHPHAGRRQERIVENIRQRRLRAELAVLGELLDRARKTRGIDAADAVAFDVVGQDVVAQHRAQPRQFELARS